MISVQRYKNNHKIVSFKKKKNKKVKNSSVTLLMKTTEDAKTRILCHFVGVDGFEPPTLCL